MPFFRNFLYWIDKRRWKYVFMLMMINDQCKMQNAKCKMLNAECSMLNAKCKMQNAEC